MERTDNLKVRYIKDKMQFFGDLLNDTESINDVLTVDIVGYGVEVIPVDKDSYFDLKFE